MVLPAPIRAAKLKKWDVRRWTALAADTVTKVEL